MKRMVKSVISVILVLVLVLALAACDVPGEKNLWESATYSEDTQLGSGSKTVTVQVTAEDKTVTFTVKTDKDTVGAALFEHNLIAGEEGAYGLYIKSVNGITADYDKDGYYWAFYIDGDYALSGVDGTEIAEGKLYQLVRSKG